MFLTRLTLAVSVNCEAWGGAYLLGERGRRQCVTCILNANVNVGELNR